MINSFSFQHDDKTFTCSVATGVSPSMDEWWWFTVTGKDASRYAPFRTAEHDTEDSVRSRILNYYATRKTPGIAYYPSTWPRRKSTS